MPLGTGVFFFAFHTHKVRMRTLLRKMRCRQGRRCGARYASPILGPWPGSGTEGITILPIAFS